ncbi:RsiV family protein [Bernardetia sp. OM2101]|uniref:RsiV family protein n=1 Tax=Bernardetia sp. OM2101 TaxID=3344876 RepID=UPI0035CFC264
MKTTIFSLTSFLFILLFSACGENSNSTSQTDINNEDSVTNQALEINHTDAAIKKITYEIFTDSGTVDLPKIEPSMPDFGATFKEQLLVVTEVPSQTNLEAIQAILQKKQNYSGNPKEALAKKKKEYFDFYIDANSEEIIGMSADWEQNKTISVVYNDNYFTTIGFYLDEYGGGARSYFSDSYLVLDLKNSKQITLSDIFDENGVAQLTKKLTSQALEMAQKEGASSMKDYGFLVKEIKPTERFIITDKGIEFTYLRTEIVIGSMPSPSFFVSWSDLKDIVKNDSPVRSLMT